MKTLFIALSLLVSAPIFAGDVSTPVDSSTAPPTQLSWDRGEFICSTQCANSSCGRVCSSQQRCQTYCTPNGDAACYCFL